MLSEGGQLSDPEFFGGSRLTTSYKIRKRKESCYGERA
jgi:hypothetical protein